MERYPLSEPVLLVLVSLTGRRLSPRVASDVLVAKRHLLPALLLLLCTIGCVRRNGRNSDCRWPGETPIHPADAYHLSADAEFAEELAIRYADVHHGLRTPYYVSGQDYVAARDRCKGELFEQMAKQHGVPIEQVYASLGHNRGLIDLAINLP